MGWDIYNEHFDHVDPHYLYPPGGTLIMAAVQLSAGRRIRGTGSSPFNTVAILIAAYLLGAGCSSSRCAVGGLPGSAARRCSAPRASVSTLVFGQHQRLHPAA